VEWTFGTLLLSSVIVFFWLAVMVMFIYTFVDILRRDISGWAKAGWITLIVLLPYFGVLAYVISAWRVPRKETRPSRADTVRTTAPADEIATAARLHEDGAITAAEFDILKRQALRY